MRAYPHELSGGLRQRVMIAIAIAGDPELIIADEPTTALDVTVQAQVLRLLQRLRDEIGCSIVFITHDLGVAAQISDRIAVLYAGRIAEIGPTAAVLGTPAHPYTHGSAALAADPGHRARPQAGRARPGRCPARCRRCPDARSCRAARWPPTTARQAPPDPDRGRARIGVSACILPADEVGAGLGATSTNTAEPFAGRRRRPATTQPPSVVLRDVAKTFTVARRWLDRSTDNHGKLHALRGVSLRVGARRVGGAGRRERLGQVDAAAGDRRPGAADRGHRSSWPTASARRWCSRTRAPR